VRKTEILVEQQPPQWVLVCDHAGLVINKFSQDTALAGAEKEVARAREELQKQNQELAVKEEEIAGKEEEIAREREEHARALWEMEERARVISAMLEERARVAKDGEITHLRTAQEAREVLQNLIRSSTQIEYDLANENYYT